jgi:hypothetical protein
MKRSANASSSTQPRASVILVAPRDDRVLTAVLASCLHQTNSDHELLLTDTWPAREGARDVVRRYETRLNLRYLESERVVTRARAYNRAADVARGATLISVPQGCLLDPGLVDAHLQACEGAPGESVVLGRQARLLTHVPPERPMDPRVALRLASHAPEWARALLEGRVLDVKVSADDIERDLSAVIRRLEHAEHPDLLHALGSAYRHVLTGHPMAWMFSASRAIRRETFLAVDGMDEGLDSQLTDLELHYRLICRRGVETHYQPLAMTYKYEPAIEPDIAGDREDRDKMRKDMRRILATYQTMEIALGIRLLFGRVNPSHVERLLGAVQRGESDVLLAELTAVNCRAAESELSALLP